MNDKEKFLKSVCIVCDTREQQNGHITAVFDKLKVNYISAKLPYGDYSFKVGEYDFTLLYAVERKANINELWGNVTKDRERFEREIKRMSAITGNATLIIENCKSREYLRAYQIPDWQMKAENRKVQSIGKPVPLWSASSLCGTAKGHGKLVIKPVLSLFPKLQGTYESWCIN